MKRRAVRFAEQWAQRLGWTLLPEWRVPTLGLARHLARLFARYSVDCVFDIGANVGQYGYFLRRDVGYRGLIVSVEPTAAAYARLAERAARDHAWLARKLALGPVLGRPFINVAASSDFSSFLPPDNIHVPDLATGNVVARTEEVEMTTFEVLAASVRIERRYRAAYLKLDTQGFDLEVLKGAGAALADVVALQSEMSVVPIYVGMPDHQTALATIEGLGFVLSGMFPVTVDGNGRLVEYDCVMVRDPR